jgi:predicted transcriptional regulator
LLAQGNDTHEQIAEKFGCSRETVTKIANGNVHKRHLQGATATEIEIIEVHPSTREK